MNDLTTRQQQVLEFIETCLEKDGRPPTLREVAGHFGWRSDNAARQHLEALETKGAIVIDRGQARGIRLVERHRPKPMREVPLVGRVPAGVPIEAIEEVERQVGLDPQMFPESDVFALTVRGDSMTGIGIHDGDTAVVRKVERAEHGDIVVAMIDGDATLKRYQLRQGHIVLHPENPAYRDIVVDDPEMFRMVGQVIGIIRRL